MNVQNAMSEETKFLDSLHIGANNRKTLDGVLLSAFKKAKETIDPNLLRNWNSTSEMVYEIIKKHEGLAVLMMYYGMSERWFLLKKVSRKYKDCHVSTYNDILQRQKHSNAMDSALLFKMSAVFVNHM